MKRLRHPIHTRTPHFRAATATTTLGLVLAFQFSKSRCLVWICLATGVVLPIAFLFA